MPEEWRDIEARGAVALVGLVAVAALGGGLAFAAIGWLSKADESVASAYLDGALLVEHARSAREEESANVRAYLLTGSEDSLATSTRERAIFESDYAGLRTSPLDAEDRELLEAVKRRDAAYEESVERVLALRCASAPEAAIRTRFEASVVPSKAELDTALLAASARAQHQVGRAHEAAPDARVRVTAWSASRPFLRSFLQRRLPSSSAALSGDSWRSACASRNLSCTSNSRTVTSTLSRAAWRTICAMPSFPS
jgi:hypothetical protein